MVDVRQEDLKYKKVYMCFSVISLSEIEVKEKVFAHLRVLGFLVQIKEISRSRCVRTSSNGIFDLTIK